MKIVCNKSEFAMLVRNCQRSRVEDGCCGCIFGYFCSQGTEFVDEDDVMDKIEDICEIEVSDG